MKSTCVHCGSNTGSYPDFTEAAIAVDQRLVEHEMTLIYGSGYMGLLGKVADADSQVHVGWTSAMKAEIMDAKL